MKVTGDGVEGTVELVVVLDEDVEFPVETMKSPPAMAGGETAVAFKAAAL